MCMYVFLFMYLTVNVLSQATPTFLGLIVSGANVHMRDWSDGVDELFL